MKATKKMASTAKRSAKVIAMAAIAGTSVSQANAAYEQAMRDMAQEYGRKNVYAIEYTWDSFTGMYA